MKNEKRTGAMMCAANYLRKKVGMLATAFLISHFSFLISSCARMGNPDGGWYDDTPPRVVSASPAEGSVNVQSKQAVINFNEFIKIENANEKVIVSPPQLEQAEIQAQGKRIVVKLNDDLKENTTYTVDFSDAIADNNEGNPMGHYTYSFSTGNHIDTLEVSGYVLNAEDLEPVKGMLVGLYPYDAHDSVFHKEAMMRVSRTNGSGRFIIKGVAPGSYRTYALNDADGDFVFGQKSEAVAYSREEVVPSWKPDTRQDTVWRDSLHISNILQVPYTHFLPDDITLLSFQEPQTDRYLIKSERPSPEKIGLYFSYGHDSLPKLKTTGFAWERYLLTEASEHRDTIFYWITDSLAINIDTLTAEVRFMGTDTLGKLTEQVDTLTFLPKVGYEKRMKDKQREFEKWQKEQEKLRKRDMPYDSVMPQKFLEVKVVPNSGLTPLDRVRLEMPVPLARCDTSKIHLYSKIDSLWFRTPHEIRQIATRTYEVDAQWQPNTEYSLEIDSAALESIYQLVNKSIKQGLKVGNPDDFSNLSIEVSGAPVTSDDSVAVVLVQVLDGSGKVVRQAPVVDGKAEFTYVKPATYYLKAFCDMNGNGKWDTGRYDIDLQPEPVFFFTEEVECKAKWDVKRRWNLTSTPRYLQKPQKLIKQKPDQAKRLKNRNLERAKQLGKEYIKDKGINL